MGRAAPRRRGPPGTWGSAAVGRLWGCRKRRVSAPEGCGAGAAGRPLLRGRAR